MAAVYFCWICGKLWDRSIPAEPHYETGARTVHFCCLKHRDSYRELAAL